MRVFNISKMYNYFVHPILNYLFIFSFCLEAKRKNEPKKKNSLIHSNAIRHCTRPLNAVKCVFA